MQEFSKMAIKGTAALLILEPLVAFTSTARLSDPDRGIKDAMGVVKIGIGITLMSI